MILQGHFYIEGNPFIIRFKTKFCKHIASLNIYIEGNPFIIRFKTEDTQKYGVFKQTNIEGNPFIIRFKTWKVLN